MERQVVDGDAAVIIPEGREVVGIDGVIPGDDDVSQVGSDGRCIVARYGG